MKERIAMNKENSLHNDWAAMPTAQLDAILQQELRKENPEEEVVLGILRALEEREADRPVTIHQEVSDAWDKYRKKTASPKKRSRTPVWFVCGAAAAMICIVLMAIPQVVEAESIFDVLFRWTESVFEFFTPEQDATTPTTQYIFETDNPGLRQVYDEVTAQGAKEPVVPMWLPEGYVLIEMKTIQTPIGVKITARFQKDDSVIVLAYRVSEDIVASRYEKEDASIKIYECAGVCHLIMDNGDNIAVTWAVGGTECSLKTDLEIEDIHQIIKSIYRRKLA